MTPDKLLVQWLQQLAEADRSVKTIARYRGIITQLLAWQEQAERRPLGLKNLTPITLISYRSYLQKKRAPATVNVHISALRSWCQWLFEKGLLEENPALNLKLVG